MNIRDVINSSLDSLWRTRARSTLTMFGMVIGVASVIVVLSIGEIAQNYILSQLNSFGTDLVYISNGPEVHEIGPAMFGKETLTIKDLKRIQALPWASAVVGSILQDDEVTADGEDMRAQVIGTTPDEVPISDFRLRHGNFFDQSAVDGHRREVVLGYDLAVKAYGEEDPVGKTVKISGTGFKVVGVLESAGTKGFTDLDKLAYIPVTTALDLYGKQYLLYIALKSDLSLTEAKDRLTALMRDRHNIDNPAGDLKKDDFHVHSQDDVIRTAGTITSILRIFLSAIAAISLLVAGIGIMNIMYVSVTERIREIGLRKSVGARYGDILRQFLLEAAFQALVGGTVGVVVGIGVAFAAISIIGRFQEGWTFSVSTQGVILGLAVSAAVGVAFGYFPARRAARLSPIEALRRE